MTQASKETIESAIELNSSLRVGCYYNAIMKVHRHFETVGIPR